MSKEDTFVEELTTPTEEDTASENQDQENNEDAGEEAAEGTEPAAKEGEEDITKEEGKSKSNWRLKRINELTFKNKQIEEEALRYKDQNEALLAKIAALQNGQSANPAEAEAQIKSLANEMAKKIAAQEIAAAQYNRDCDRVFDKGVKEYPEFKECIENLNGSFGERWNNAIPTLVDALDDAHKVIYHLGTNLDEANRIFSMSPARQIAELTRLEAILAKPESKPISKASAPIKPVEGRTATPISIADTSDTEKWIKGRYKDIAAKEAAKKR